MSITVAADQRFWGERVKQLDVASAMIPYRRWFSPSHPWYTAAQAKSRREDGIGTTVHIIENYLR